MSGNKNLDLFSYLGSHANHSWWISRIAVLEIFLIFLICSTEFRHIYGCLSPAYLTAGFCSRPAASLTHYHYLQNVTGMRASDAQRKRWPSQKMTRKHSLFFIWLIVHYFLLNERREKHHYKAMIKQNLIYSVLTLEIFCQERTFICLWRIKGFPIQKDFFLQRNVRVLIHFTHIPSMMPRFQIKSGLQWAGMTSLTLSWNVRKSVKGRKA